MSNTNEFKEKKKKLKEEIRRLEKDQKDSLVVAQNYRNAIYMAKRELSEVKQVATRDPFKNTIDPETGKHVKKDYSPEKTAKIHQMNADAQQQRKDQINDLEETINNCQNIYIEAKTNIRDNPKKIDMAKKELIALELSEKVDKQNRKVAKHEGHKHKHHEAKSALMGDSPKIQTPPPKSHQQHNQQKHVVFKGSNRGR